MDSRGTPSGNVRPDADLGRATPGGEHGRPDGDLPPPSRWRILPLGCLMTVAGFFSGAMIAVLVAKVRGALIHCQPVSADLPACDWQNFAGVGGVLGALSLPSLVLWRLRTPRRARREDEQGGMDL
jgi:hypothetical protein